MSAPGWSTPSAHEPGRRLEPWLRVGGYLLAGVLGAAAWLATAATVAGSPAAGRRPDAVGLLLTVDLVVGLLALGLLVGRRRRPYPVAVATAVLTAVSNAAVGPATVALAVASVARRPRQAVTLAVVVLLARVTSVVLTSRVGELTFTATGLLLDLVLSGLLVAAAVATGWYVGTRRALVVSLRERAATADRERGLAVEAARAAERTRIAREMHDVLAHRVSLVALHAGALAYREDLDRATTAQTARTIRANAELALSELRDVLGVLRTAPPSGVEEPQPTLAELPALLADAREAGTHVDLDLSGLPGGRPDGLALPATTSRTAFRIVQESMTNARRHAPGAPVVVRVAGSPVSGRLEVEVVSGPGTAGEPGPPGVGLAGLRERVDVVGGTIDAGPRAAGGFVVRASLPWDR